MCVAAVEGMPLYSVCWREPMLWEYVGERLAREFWEAMFLPVWTEVEGSQPYKSGFLILKMYLYVFALIQHSLHKYSLGAYKMQTSGPGNEATKTNKVMRANLWLISL